MAIDGLRRRDVLNAFQPAKEIEEARRFAGRRKELMRALDALMTDGSQLCVLGQRGIGKSSFARQLGKVAEGDRETRLVLGIEGTERLDFLVLRIACDDTIINLDALLKRLLTSTEGMADWAVDPASKRIVNDARNFQILPGGIGAKTTHFETLEHEPYAPGLVGSFIEVVGAIERAAPTEDGILLIIDEYDRVKDRSGLASLLKALDGSKLKMMLVGVADDLKSLVSEHASLQRQLAEGVIPVARMDSTEMYEIVDKAIDVLDGKMLFHGDAKARLAELAGGQPYLVHLFGKYALLVAYDAGADVVTNKHLSAAITEVSTMNYAEPLEDRYRVAIKSSGPRESVLRGFAAITSDRIANKNAYDLCKDVEKPAVYLGHLRQEKYGAELVDRGNRYHEFRDALFKAYVNATPRRFPAGPNVR